MLSKHLFEARLNLDGDDLKILSLFKQNAELTQDEISNVIKKVQPAVSGRIMKLERESLLVPQYGCNLEHFGVPLSIARISTRNSRRSLESLKNCDCALNAFMNLGKFNITAIVLGNQHQKIENIIKQKLDSPGEIRQLSISPVIYPLKRNLFPVDPFLISDSLNNNAGLMADSSTFPHVDDLDRQILLLLHDNPHLTQGKIAEVIGRSQASVSNRVINLHRKGVLVLNKGVNFKKTRVLHLIQAEIFTRDARSIALDLSRCWAVPLGYHVQNKASIIAFFVGSSIEQIIGVIDDCFQHDERVFGVETHPILDYAHDLILPLTVGGTGDLDTKCEICRVSCIDEFCNGQNMRILSTSEDRVFSS